MDHDRIPFRVYEPVLPHADSLVEVSLDALIHPTRTGRQNLDDDRRCTADVLVGDDLGLAREDDEKIRFDDVEMRQDDVERRVEDLADWRGFKVIEERDK